VNLTIGGIFCWTSKGQNWHIKAFKEFTHF
jgi:hypothetical protein